MIRKIWLLFSLVTLLLLTVPDTRSQSQAPPNIALLNGQWFNGRGFEARIVYSVNGRFTAKKPAHVDRMPDLAGTWIIPPFAEAHNHNLNGIEDRDQKAMQST